MDVAFRNRRAAGQALATALAHFQGRKDVIVLALPRGGLPVADEVARTLGADLDVILVRKLGVPWHPELAMGAIASGGSRVLNENLMRSLGLDEQALEDVEKSEREELHRRESAYRGQRPWPALGGRCVILVDDGLATGATMLAAVEAVRQDQPGRLVVAVPVAPPDTIARLRNRVDEVLCLKQPEPFGAVGAWYRDFGQVGDEEVREILAQAWGRAKPAGDPGEGES